MTYHWIITLQSPSASGETVGTFYGTVDPAPGQTRGDVYARLRNRSAAQLPGTAQPTVLFFALEPEDLHAAAGTVLTPEQREVVLQALLDGRAWREPQGGCDDCRPGAMCTAHRRDAYLTGAYGELLQALGAR